MDNSWEAGPAIPHIKRCYVCGQNVGFSATNYAEGMDGNLYMTKDGGKTFSKSDTSEQGA